MLISGVLLRASVRRAAHESRPFGGIDLPFVAPSGPAGGAESQVFSGPASARRSCPYRDLPSEPGRRRSPSLPPSGLRRTPRTPVSPASTPDELPRPGAAGTVRRFPVPRRGRHRTTLPDAHPRDRGCAAGHRRCGHRRRLGLRRFGLGSGDSGLLSAFSSEELRLGLRRLRGGLGRRGPGVGRGRLTRTRGPTAPGRPERRRQRRRGRPGDGGNERRGDENNGMTEDVGEVDADNEGAAVEAAEAADPFPGRDRGRRRRRRATTSTSATSRPTATSARAAGSRGGLLHRRLRRERPQQLRQLHGRAGQARTAPSTSTTTSATRAPTRTPTTTRSKRPATSCVNGDRSTFFWPVLRDINGAEPRRGRGRRQPRRQRRLDPQAAARRS